MVVVRAATPEDWQVLRDTRLAALRESPSAFGSTADREAAFDEPTWRAWTQLNGTGVTYLAEVAGRPEPVGLAGVLKAGDEAHLIAMWVRPAARGQQVGEALIEATVGWARSQGLGPLCLGVTESNAAARTLYERCGFTDTGERRPLPSDPALLVITMSRPLLAAVTLPGAPLPSQQPVCPPAHRPHLAKAHSEPPDCRVEPTVAQFAYDHCHELAFSQAPYTVLPLVQVA